MMLAYFLFHIVNLCWFILELQPTFNVRLFETVHDVYIYTVFNEVSRLNISNNYYSIFNGFHCEVMRINTSVNFSIE